MSDNPARLRLSNVLDDIIGARIGEIGGAVVCRVVSFDRTSQTATVAPQVRIDGEQQPQVRNVPVLFPVAYSDIQAETFGVLVVGGRNWRRWWRTGEISDPEDDAIHDLTNGIFLPDLRTQGSPRNLDSGTSVLLRPTAGGEVRLGTYNASKAVVHEDALTEILTWAAAVSAAITGLGGDVTAALATLNTNLPGEVSPSVMVED